MRSLRVRLAVVVASMTSAFACGLTATGESPGADDLRDASREGATFPPRSDGAPPVDAEPSPMDGGDRTDGSPMPSDADVPDVRPPVEAGSCPAACNAGCAPGAAGTCTIDCGGGRCDPGVSCPPGRPCRVLCTATNDCKDVPILCGSATSCTLECVDASSCEGTSIDCGTAACRVRCGVGTGTNACNSMSIVAPNAPTLCLACDALGANAACNSLACTVDAAKCTKHCQGQACNSIGACGTCTDVGGCP